MMQAEVGDISIRYQVSGQGPWLTLSHSLASDNSMWKPQIEALTPHFTILSYDTRGHGGTTVTKGSYTLEQLANDAAGLLSYLGVSRTHWLGLSMGGMIGQKFALQYPEKLDRVILADTTGFVAPVGAAMWHERAAAARASGMAALEQGTLSRWFTDDFCQKEPKVVDSIGALIRATAVEGYAGCCAALAQTNMLDSLKALQIPALVLVGENDNATPVAAAQAIASHWPGAKLKILHSAAHLANVEQAQAFNEAVLEFLAPSSPVQLRSIGELAKGCLQN